MRKEAVLVSILSVCLVVASSFAVVPGSEIQPVDRPESPFTLDYSTFINANSVLMFVSNTGNFGYNKDDLFDAYYGTFYPYVSLGLLESGELTKTLQEVGGVWLGGKVGGEIRVAIASYENEFAPGPMVSGTFQPDDPAFKVYKLYADSLEDNPNADYLNWPVDQGAPVDGQGRPLMYGDQMLWSVYNDANPSTHTADGGGTAPLGIEIQQTTWASFEPGSDTLAIGDPIAAVSATKPDSVFTVYPAEPGAITGHDYRIVFRDDPDSGLVWILYDADTGDSLGTNVEAPAVVDGFSVVFTPGVNGVKSIREIETDTGLVSPPDGWNVMCSLNSSGDWTVMSDQSCNFARMNWQGLIGTSDWEIRFTPSGSQYYNYVTDELFPSRAPFEVWNIGSGTPDDPSDDKRIFFEVIDDDGSGGWSWGDRLYPFEIEYFEPAPANAATLYTWPSDFRIGRIVFYDDSGLLPAPVENTVVRFSTYNGADLIYTPADTFTFSAPSAAYAVTGGEGNTIYQRYKLYNKGGNTIDSCYFSLFSDQFIGNYMGLKVGCDTSVDAWFSYWGADFSTVYATKPPAVGMRFMYGPLVPSPGDTAVFDGNVISDYRNLGLTAFREMINYYPGTPTATLELMQGLQISGGPLVYDGDTTTFEFSGDPVTGTGWLDPLSGGVKEMVATVGPFTMNPGDSQYVLVKYAVGQGNDRLASITNLRELLSAPLVIPTAVNDGTKPELPEDFALGQNYPNPFNPSTRINYWLPQKAHVEIEVFNILGQKVTTLVNEDRSAGAHTAVWNGTDASGSQVSTGIYFYRITAGDFVESKKMLLLK